MQALLQDVLDPAIVQLGVQQAGLPRRFAGLPVGDQIEVLDHAVHAEMQRARHVLVENQQLGDAIGGNDIAIDLAIHLKSRNRTQQRSPFIEIGGAFVVMRAQHVVFDVEDARRVVGPLQQGADTDEIVGLVLQQRAQRGATRQRRAHLDPLEKVADAGAPDLLETFLARL